VARRLNQMCGIVGMIGRRDCASVLLEGLKRLEYRGYDSAGIATVDRGEFRIVRSVGKLARLEEALHANTPAGVVGIGHTRWATHGRPSEENAHPHRYKDVVVVHNGIIENHALLRRELCARGHVFSSQTDSEILAHLVQEAYEDGGDLVGSVRTALGQVRGSFAVAVLHIGHPDAIVAARRMSPLVVGLGQGESYVASDVPALLAVTRRFVFLEDGDLALVTADKVEVFGLTDLAPVVRKPRDVAWTPAMAEKGGYKHFMLKEIFEQPRSISDTLGPRLNPSTGDVMLEELDRLGERIDSAGRACMVACGTSYHAGLIGKYFIEQLARIPCDVEVASEFRYRDPIVDAGTMLVTVSQSGETADTIAAAIEAKRRGAFHISVCNVVDSSLPRMADAAVYTYAGPEIGVASTKAFTSQIMVLELLAIWCARRRGAISASDAGRLLQGLAELPVHMEKVLACAPQIQDVARKHLRVQSMLYLGRGASFPIALEGALKLKELSYVHAEGYPAGEMKHGPIALVDDGVPSLFVVPDGPVFEKSLSNIEEIKSRGGPVIAVASEGESRLAGIADDLFTIPKTGQMLHPFLSVLPLQLFAYYVADLRGTDVDQPRNLAKSVTVE